MIISKKTCNTTFIVLKNALFLEEAYSPSIMPIDTPASKWQPIVSPDTPIVRKYEVLFSGPKEREKYESLSGTEKEGYVVEQIITNVIYSLRD